MSIKYYQINTFTHDAVKYEPGKNCTIFFVLAETNLEILN